MLEKRVEYLNIQKRLSPLQILKIKIFFFPREPNSPNLMFLLFPPPPLLDFF